MQCTLATCAPKLRGQGQIRDMMTGMAAVRAFLAELPGPQVRPSLPPMTRFQKAHWVPPYFCKVTYMCRRRYTRCHETKPRRHTAWRAPS